MKERLLLLYRLNNIDRELHELYSLRGDIPAKIDDLNAEKKELDDRTAEIQTQLGEILAGEKNVMLQNDELLEKMEKNDELLRSGGVRSNKEYDALAREIDDAKLKIQANERSLKEDKSGQKTALENEIILIKVQLEEVNTELEQNQRELEELTKQTGEEEKELSSQRDEILPKIEAEDKEYYDRISKVRFGEAIAVVRKGSCLGCYSSIPPQKAIEIRMAEKFYACESCGIFNFKELITITASAKLEQNKNFHRRRIKRQPRRSRNRGYYL
jgi:predicted  nucleic acid-binding Zn-ribbon protein